MQVATKPHFKRVDGNWVDITAQTSHIAADIDTPALCNWTPQPLSADTDLLPEIGTMNGRSRDLERNNGIASSAINTLADNVIGNVLKLSASPNRKLLGLTPEQADDWAHNTEGEFETWFDSKEADAAGVQTGWGLAHLALRSAFLNGSCVALPKYLKRPGHKWQTCIQIIESDRLEAPAHVAGYYSIQSPVITDSNGRPTHYWIKKTHPGDYTKLFGGALNDYVKIPAFTPWGRPRVIHLFEKTRPGQTTGRTIFAAVMQEFKVMDRYVKAELDAAVANALTAAFLESVSDPESVIQAYGGVDAGMAYSKSLAGFSVPTGAGAVVPLPYGVSVSNRAPGRPNAAFDGFMESILRKIAAGLNLPYEVATKDFSKVNYAAARAALQEAWRYITSRRRWFTDGFLMPLYELWMEEAIEKNRVVADGFYENKQSWLRSNWIMSGRGQIDPWRETRASQQKLASKISTLKEECAQNGTDWRDVIDQARLEEAAIKGAQITLPDFLAEQQEDSETVE